MSQAEHTSYVARVHEQIVHAIGDYQAEWPATDSAILDLARAADQDISDLRTQRDMLVDALKPALVHVQELRGAFQRGVIDERDCLGGIRSNRNVDVEVKLRAALAAVEKGEA